MHTVEKIGGTSMSHYSSVRDNIILKPTQHKHLYHRVFVVSAYGGVTDKLLDHKKSGQPGVFKLFSNSIEDDSWLTALNVLRAQLHGINAELFGGSSETLSEANRFVNERLIDAQKCLLDLQSLCRHGHFSLNDHLDTVREMLASIGEAHSAWNMTTLLKRDGINAHFVDLTGWKAESHLNLDERIKAAFASLDLGSELPIVTGYTHTQQGLMTHFDRGYSEMTFSRIAVLTNASEAIIHKEFHLSSADPRLVGEHNAVPIGRTNYDVADQLANLGMEAIHPKAAKGLRQNNIPLRVKNTFEPEHYGTLITGDYISDTPCVEIVAGTKGIYALEVFDQDMAGLFHNYDPKIVSLIHEFKAHIVSKDINANTITHYLATNLKTVKRIRRKLEEAFPEAEIDQKKVAVVSVIGSDLKIKGMLAKASTAIANADIDILSVHQCLRQVDVQFVIEESDYEKAVKALHATLVEIHDHGQGHMSRVITTFFMLLGLSVFSMAEDTTSETMPRQTLSETVETLDDPLYTPFIERYMLDELKALRTEMLLQKNELQKQILDREHQSVDRAVTYATNTVTYFFYLVAAASSILVIVGWTSIRDIKERVHTYANDEITKLVNEYENRLGAIEKQLLARTKDIKENREELETTKEVQSLWLRAQQELNPSGKIRTYDQILSIDPEDTEAITYKADAVLELGEPQWAVNLCQQALEKDEENAHALYQLACAYAQLGNVEESIRCIKSSIEQNESYREEVLKEEFLANIRELDEFQELFFQPAIGEDESPSKNY